MLYEDNIQPKDEAARSLRTQSHSNYGIAKHTRHAAYSHYTQRIYSTTWHRSKGNPSQPNNGHLDVQVHLKIQVIRH